MLTHVSHPWALQTICLALSAIFPALLVLLIFIAAPLDELSRKSSRPTHRQPSPVITMKWIHR